MEKQEDRAQNIWIPNTNKEEVIQYLDSQVKYGVEYEYEIFAYQLVVGSKYKYERRIPWYTGENPQPVDYAGNWVGSGWGSEIVPNSESQPEPNQVIRKPEN